VNMGVFRLRVPMPPVIQSAKQAKSVLVFNWSAVAGLTYDVQYSTNLAKTNWNVLGNTTTATNGIMTTTDSVGSSAQRFYRILMNP